MRTPRATSQYKRAYRLVTNDMQLIDTLAAMRRSKHISVETAAARIGTTPAELEAIENGITDPTLSVVRRFALAVGATVEHEVSDSDENH